MYEKNIDDSNYQNALCPNQKLLHKVTTSHPGVKKIYVSVVWVINNLLMQILMENTMTTNGEKGKSIKTNIAEVHASRVSCFPLDDIEFFEWTRTNKYGRLWYCPDISQSPILQCAIEKAIRKCKNMTSAIIRTNDHLLKMIKAAQGINPQMILILTMMMLGLHLPEVKMQRVR